MQYVVTSMPMVLLRCFCFRSRLISSKKDPLQTWNEKYER